MVRRLGFGLGIGVLQTGECVRLWWVKVRVRDRGTVNGVWEVGWVRVRAKDRGTVSGGVRWVGIVRVRDRGINDSREVGIPQNTGSRVVRVCSRNQDIRKLSVPSIKGVTK